MADNSIERVRSGLLGSVPDGHTYPSLQNGQRLGPRTERPADLVGAGLSVAERVARGVHDVAGRIRRSVPDQFTARSGAQGPLAGFPIANGEDPTFTGFLTERADRGDRVGVIEGAHIMEGGGPEHIRMSPGGDAQPKASDKVGSQAFRFANPNIPIVRIPQACVTALVAADTNYVLALPPGTIAFVVAWTGASDLILSNAGAPDIPSVAGTESASNYWLNPSPFTYFEVFAETAFTVRPIGSQALVNFACYLQT